MKNLFAPLLFCAATAIAVSTAQADVDFSKLPKDLREKVEEIGKGLEAGVTASAPETAYNQAVEKQAKEYDYTITKLASKYGYSKPAMDVIGVIKQAIDNMKDKQLPAADEKLGPISKPLSISSKQIKFLIEEVEKMPKEPPTKYPEKCGVKDVPQGIVTNLKPGNIEKSLNRRKFVNEKYPNGILLLSEDDGDKQQFVGRIGSTSDDPVIPGGLTTEVWYDPKIHRIVCVKVGK